MAEACSPAHTQLNEFIRKGEDLIGRCRSRKDIHGAPKLARKIQAEVKFLNKVSVCLVLYLGILKRCIYVKKTVKSMSELNCMLVP